MELQLDEQSLLASFRRLPPEGKREVLDFVALLVERYREPGQKEHGAGNQCSLTRREGRPEAGEPIFTE